MNPWPKYVIINKKKCVCVFFSPILLFSSGAVLSDPGAGVCFLAVWPAPSFYPLCLRLTLHGCLLLWLWISGHQVPGGLESSPSSLPLLPALPLGEGPQPGPASPQPPQVMSLGHTSACWAPLRWRPALTELLGRGGGALLVGVILWPLTWGPPAAPGPPSLSVATGLSASSSVGPVTQPCNLTETHFFSPGL